MMTLQNSLYHRGEVWLWSDTGSWDEAGQLVGTWPKVYAGTLWPWVMTYSGVSPADDPHRVARLLSDRPSFTPEALLKDAEAVLREEAQDGRLCRLMFAWPDHRRGARMFHIAAEEMPGREPFQVVELSKYMSWGAGESWAEPMLAREMTPDLMRKYIALQLDRNGEEVYGTPLQDAVTDVIETRVGRAGISHTVYRRDDRTMDMVPVDALAPAETLLATA